MMARTISGCLMAACAAVLLGSGPAAAGEDVPLPRPLLFNEGEAGAVTRAILDFERLKVTGTAAPVEEPGANAPESPNVFVSALAYYGEGQWTVWANGYRVSPGRQPPAFTVISVNDERAEIAVAGSKPAHFMLRPYQTWRSRFNDIVEGIVP